MGNRFINDIIVVKQRNGKLLCSPFRLPHQEDMNWTVSINGVARNLSLNELIPTNESNDGDFRFTSQCLKRMQLRPDLNDITFNLGQDDEVKARMFLWRWDSRIVITDVDGTITKSDIRGIVFSYMGIDWTQDGVCHLFSAIEKNGYKVIYLTGRPIDMVEKTRDTLDDIKQGDEALPKGPVIGSLDGWIVAFKREALKRTQYRGFKSEVLQQIRELFLTDHRILDEAGPFHAGFGNRRNDKWTYLKLKIPCTRIFHLNRSKERIEVKCDEETVGHFFRNSYEGLSECVNCLFPRVQDSQNFARRFKEYFKSCLPYH